MYVYILNLKYAFKLIPVPNMLTVNVKYITTFQCCIYYRSNKHFGYNYIYIYIYIYSTGRDSGVVVWCIVHPTN